MAIDTPPVPIREEDYEAIESAVMETARGRWFLKEYTRRHRSADTNMLLDAISRLEKTITGPQPAHDVDAIRFDLADMANAIERTKEEISRLQSENNPDNQFERASSELDAIVGQTETATSEILSAAETIQEIAWTLRESQVDEEACDTLDARSTEIYMACSFQDLTGQRIQKVVHVLKYLEGRINAMMDIWGEASEAAGATPAASSENPFRPAGDTRPDAHLLNGPQLEGEGVDQSDVDMLLSGASADDMEFDAIDITPSAEAVTTDPVEMVAEPAALVEDATELATDDIAAFDADLAEDIADLDSGFELDASPEVIPADEPTEAEVVAPVTDETLETDFSEAMADAGISIDIETDADDLSFGERAALTQ